MIEPAPAASGPGFFAVPARDHYALRRIHLPASATFGMGEPDGDIVAADLLIDRGRIAAIEPAGSLDASLGPDLDGAMILPGLIDCHTHLDKGHIWPRSPNLTGDVPGAALATTLDRTARWTAEDVERRMEFGLKTAYSRGVTAIRTHLDSLAPQAEISFPVFRMMRDRWAGRIDLQASSIGPLDMFLREEGARLADIVAKSGGNLGCATRFAALPNDYRGEAFQAALANLFALASARGLDLDLHVDETGDPDARSLIEVARMALKTGFKGQILCGHCSSLAVQPDEAIEETIRLVAQAGVAVVSLPVVNMYLQARVPGRTPRWRGVTVLHEMKAAGIRVAVAGDNVRDPFYAYGDHDMLETFSQSVKILHLDHPIGDWLRASSTTPAEIMGLTDRGTIRADNNADLIVVRARNYSELLSRAPFDRVVIRKGLQIDTRLPDYRELDKLMVTAR